MNMNKENLIRKFQDSFSNFDESNEMIIAYKVSNFSDYLEKEDTEYAFATKYTCSLRKIYFKEDYLKIADEFDRLTVTYPYSSIRIQRRGSCPSIVLYYRPDGTEKFRNIGLYVSEKYADRLSETRRDVYYSLSKGTKKGTVKGINAHCKATPVEGGSPLEFKSISDMAEYFNKAQSSMSTIIARGRKVRDSEGRVYIPSKITIDKGCRA